MRVLAEVMAAVRLGMVFFLIVPLVGLKWFVTLLHIKDVLVSYLETVYSG
jgi:hypothetical protein